MKNSYLCHHDWIMVGFKLWRIRRLEVFGLDLKGNKELFGSFEQVVIIKVRNSYSF